MRSILVFIVIFSNTVIANCQETTLSSVFSMETDNIYSGKNSVIYKDSIIYSVGSFEGTIETDGTQLSTNSSRGIYLLKTTVNNEFVWLKKIADNEFQVVLDPTLTIDVDSIGDIVVGIGFRDKLYYSGDSTLVDDNVNNDHGIVVLKLDNDANLIWDRYIPATWLGIQGVRCENNNDVLVTGRNSDNFFLTKITSQGDSVWTKTGGGSNSNVPVSGGFIVVDEQNNYYCAGGLVTSNIIYFDQEHPVFNALDMGKKGSFVAKYDSSGNIQWLKCLFASSEQIQFAPIVSLNVKNNNILVAGKYNSNYLRSSPNEGSIGPNNTNNLYTGFLIMYDEVGNRIWSKKTHASHNGDDELMCAALTDDGYFYTASNFDAAMDVNGTSISGGSFGNLVIEKYSIDGNILDYFLIEGTTFEYVYDIILTSNDFFVFGTTNSNPLNINGSPVNLTVNPAFYIAKLNDNIVSLEETTLAEYLFYPNPASDHIGLISTESMLNKEVVVLNAQGQKVAVHVLRNQFTNEIELPDASGIYFLKIEGIGKMERVVKN